MISLSVHSHNLRGSLKSIDWIADSLECECTAVLLQDIGLTGPEGPRLLRNHKSFEGHLVYANSSNKNKSRSVCIIVHKNWHVLEVLRDPTGSLVG